MNDFKPQFPEHKFMVTLWYFDQEHDKGRDHSVETMEDAIRIARNQELFDGKYAVRVYDAEGNIVMHIKSPYERVHVDIAKDDWLDSIRAGYGIPKDVFRKACERWLSENSEGDK